MPGLRVVTADAAGAGTGIAAAAGTGTGTGIGKGETKTSRETASALEGTEIGTEIGPRRATVVAMAAARGK